MAEVQQRLSIFDELAVLPAETYAEHKVLAQGFTEFEPEEQEKTPWIAHGMMDYHISIDIDHMSYFASEAFYRMGGSATSRVLEYSSDALTEFCNDWDKQSDYGVYSGAKDVALLVSKYLSGQKTDEECKNLANWLDPMFFKDLIEPEELRRFTNGEDI